MKQGRALINLVMVFLAVALVCYLGIYAWRGLSDPFSTTYAYEYTVGDGVEAEGFLARDERVFAPQAGIVDVSRSEGEKVGVGQTVARVHRDSVALESQKELDELAMEISLMDYALGQEDTMESSARMDESILQAVVELRASAAVGDYAQLEDQVLSVKSQVLKRDYTYSQDLSMTDLAEQRNDLARQYKDLQSSSAGATSRVTAPEAGTFSARVDGYESLLTPESIFTLTPTQLDGLMEHKTQTGGETGKLILGDSWYFVAALPAQQAGQLRAGITVTAVFSGDFNRDVPMTVEQVGEEEDGRCAVVFSTDRYLSQTTLLRQQSVEIVFDHYSGLRVPKTALRMVTETVTDKEDGQEVEHNTLGVYVVTSGQAEFKEVQVVTEGSDYYVVSPTSEGSRALRAGDEVIVRATDLYDGKLLRY